MEFSREMCLVREWSLPGEVPAMKIFIVENFGLITNKTILEAFLSEAVDLQEQNNNVDGHTELVTKYNIEDGSLLLRIFFNGKFVLEIM